MLSQEPPKAVAKILVLAVWGITPLSWTYFILFILYRTLLAENLADGLRHVVRGTLPVAARRFPRFSRALSSRGWFLYALIEVLFSLYYRHLAARVQVPGVSHTATRNYVVKAITTALSDGMNKEGTDRKDLFKAETGAEQLPEPNRHLDWDDPRAVEFRREMSGWFIGIKTENITRQDVYEWLSWALFGKFYKQLQEEDKEHGEESEHAQKQLEFLEDAIRLFAARSGRKEFPEHVELSPEEKRSKRTMLLSLDPVRVSSRPFGLYAAVALGNELARFIWSRRYGMQRLKIGDVSYLLYIPSEWSASAAKKGEMPLPVLFLHGLGIGMVQYVDVVRGLLNPELMRQPRPVLIPLQPWTSGDILSPRFLRPWRAPESAALIRAMIERHGFDECGVSVMSHSMGTILHTWLLKHMSDLIQRSILVDPVCFQLWAPHLCYRFLYKKANTFIEYALRYFVARELGTANVLTRNFDWSSNVLFIDDIPNHDNPNRTRVYLAGSDTVVDAPVVERFLARNGMRDVLEYRKGLHHGTYVMGPGNVLPQIVSELDAPLK